MSENERTVRIFMMPLQYPCGPGSACCGPIGQSDEEINKLKKAIEQELKVKVEVLNSMDGKVMKNFLNIVRLLRSFGPNALPIITLDGEVVSIGNPLPEQAVSAIREKLN